MKKIRSLFALLLALTLLCTIQSAALAADVSLACNVQADSGDITLRLDGLGEGGVYGVQVELTLPGRYPGCTFAPGVSSATLYSPDCTVELTDAGETRVVIYMTDQTAMNSGGSLAAGTLRLGAPLTGALPGAAQVKLLNRGLSVSMEGSIPVSSSSGPGGGDIPPGPVAPPSTNPSNPPAITPNPGGTKPSQPPAQEQPGQPDPGTQVPDPAPDYASTVLPFTDVAERDWFYGAVQYVYAKGMMGGTDSATFSPGGTTTRGMIVTILHRLEGTPAGAAPTFTDVPAGQYYTAAVGWAASADVVNGYGDGAFQPNAPITREQLAAILYRYAQYKGIDVSRRAGLDQFPDSAKVSPYAVEALGWAVDAGLIAGMDGQLAPGGSATRAQVATILMRLCVTFS